MSGTGEIDVRQEDQEKIKEVIINEGAKVIGEKAFGKDTHTNGCRELTAVSVPSTVVEIGSFAFFA